VKSLINKSKRKCFFEGWYFKQQAGNRIISFIPGYHTDAIGNSYAFLQIIMNDNSYQIPFSIQDFSIDRRKLIIRLGKNVFSRRGIKVNINTEEIHIKGILAFGRMKPVRYTIMGFFKFFPAMECKHEIISMYHKVVGNINCNGKEYVFHPGTGYVEKDVGHSFPKSYLWIQCNHFPGTRCSVFISIAEIPYHGIHFKGCICAILYKGREYRFATYLGVKILESGPREICLKQGGYLFKIILSPLPCRAEKGGTAGGHEFSHDLFAPVKGEFTKTIKEQHLTEGRFLLYNKGNLIFDLTSRNVSFEYVE